MTAQESLIHLTFHLVGMPDRRYVLKQGREKRIYHHHYHHHCHIHAFRQKDNKHRQRYNHALTDPRKRKGWLTREESDL